MTTGKVVSSKAPTLLKHMGKGGAQSEGPLSLFWAPQCPLWGLIPY